MQSTNDTKIEPQAKKVDADGASLAYAECAKPGESGQGQGIHYEEANLKRNLAQRHLVSYHRQEKTESRSLDALANALPPRVDDAGNWWCYWAWLLCRHGNWSLGSWSSWPFNLLCHHRSSPMGSDAESWRIGRLYSGVRFVPIVC